MDNNELGRVADGDQALAVPATPAGAVDGPSGFDPSRVRRLLDAVDSICALVAEYATSAGPIREPNDRIIGRVTWGDFCEIEDAAQAIETRQGGDAKQAPSRSDESAGLKGIAQ